MKKIICCLAAGVFLLASLAACAKSGEPESSEPSVDQEVLSVSQEFTDKDLSGDFTEPGAVLIECAGKSAAVSGSGAAVSEGNILITAAGTYILSGEFQGSVTVQAADTAGVQLVLRGVSVSSPNGPAVMVLNADKVFLTLAAGTENALSDGADYAVSDEDMDACLYSKADLTINGSGSLSVTGNYNHGVHSKDDLILASAALTVTAVNDGLKGKDAVLLKGVRLNVVAGGDGIQSNNDEDSEKGVVLIDGGTYAIEAGEDGIQAETVLEIRDGSFSITTGGGAGGSASEESAKGLKAGSFLNVSGGSFVINSRDDSAHTNGGMDISGGTLTLTSGDDGLHADATLTVTAGDITIKQSYEGIEASVIALSGGNIRVTASDDGLNAAGGNDASSLNRPGENPFAADSGCSIHILGGTLVITASGDGVDSNGSLFVSGGTTLVSGPTNNGNGALDYASAASITGGVFIAAGSSGMAQNFGSSSTQGSLLVLFSEAQAAGSPFALYGEDGLILAFAPEHDYACALVSAPALKADKSYEVTTGGSLLGEGGFTETDYSGGNTAFTFTLKELVSTLSSSGISGSTGGGGFGGGGTPGGKTPGNGTIPGDGAMPGEGGKGQFPGGKGTEQTQ